MLDLIDVFKPVFLFRVNAHLRQSIPMHKFPSTIGTVHTHSADS